jgi:hypothetical protein
MMDSCQLSSTPENLTFGEWAGWFLEVRSKPPFYNRAEGTHRQNLNAVGAAAAGFWQNPAIRHHGNSHRVVLG